MHASRVLFGSFVFNEQYAAGAPPTTDPAHLQDATTVDSFQVVPSFRDTRDPLHLAQGGEAGLVHKGMSIIAIKGRMLANGKTGVRTLDDLERALRYVLDPTECVRLYPTQDGVQPLTWYSQTADTTTYPTGWMNLCYYVRPVDGGAWIDEAGQSSVRRYQAAFVAPDPRLYENGIVETTVNPASGPVTLTNNGSTPSPLRVTLTMSGAGNAAFTITRDLIDFTLDLSTCVGGDEVVVTMETCGPFGTGRSVYTNAINTMSRKTSGPTTWLDVPAGATAFSFANTTGVSSVLLEHLHTRP